MKNTTSNANVTLLPGVVNLNLTGSLFLGALNCSDNANLTNITAPNLKSVGEMTLRNLPRLKTIDMPALFISSNATLDHIGNSTTPVFLEIKQSLGLTNTSLEVFAAWAQEILDVEVAANAQLKTLAFPMLRKLGGGLRIENNSQLHDIEASFPLLQDVGGSLQISGNISSLVILYSYPLFQPRRTAKRIVWPNQMRLVLGSRSQS